MTEYKTQVREVQVIYFEEEHKMWLKTSRPCLYFYSHEEKQPFPMGEPVYESPLTTKLQEKVERLLNKTWQSIRSRTAKTERRTTI
jgi:hypothetical protein